MPFYSLAHSTSLTSFTFLGVDCETSQIVHIEVVLQLPAAMKATYKKFPGALFMYLQAQWECLRALFEYFESKAFHKRCTFPFTTFRKISCVCMFSAFLACQRLLAPGYGILYLPTLANFDHVSWLYECYLESPKKWPPQRFFNFFITIGFFWEVGFFVITHVHQFSCCDSCGAANKLSHNV